MNEIAHLLSSSPRHVQFARPPHSRVCVSDQEFEFNLLATARSQGRESTEGLNQIQVPDRGNYHLTTIS